MGFLGTLPFYRWPGRVVWVSQVYTLPSNRLAVPGIRRLGPPCWVFCTVSLREAASSLDRIPSRNVWLQNRESQEADYWRPVPRKQRSSRAGIVLNCNYRHMAGAPTRTGKRSRLSGIYHSACHGAERTVLEGQLFPLCGRCDKDTSWIFVGNVRPPSYQSVALDRSPTSSKVA